MSQISAMLGRPVTRSFLAGISLMVPAIAFACPICIPSQGGGIPSLERIAGAGALVLAAPQEPARRLKIESVIKGKLAPGAVIEIAYADMPRAPFEAGKSVIVARHPLLNAWQPLGATPREREKWLREALALKPAGELAPDEWPLRVRSFADDLFSSDAFVSGVAANQIARAPYAAMRTLRGKLDGARLVAATNRIENIPHLPLLILLMGVAGDEPSRTFIEQRARTAGSLANANELAALLTAQIEIDGEGALASRGREILAGASRRPSDMSAAVMALGVFAGAFGEARPSSRFIAKGWPRAPSFPAMSRARWRTGATGRWRRRSPPPQSRRMWMKARACLFVPILKLRRKRGLRLRIR
jgi:hypothetical protein